MASSSANLNSAMSIPVRKISSYDQGRINSWQKKCRWGGVKDIVTVVLAHHIPLVF